MAGFWNIVRRFSQLSVRSVTKNSSELVPGGNWSFISARTNIRVHFPKPKEVKRVKVHGWNTRMQTPEGRRVLIRRILKGRHVLAH